MTLILTVHDIKILCFFLYTGGDRIYKGQKGEPGDVPQVSYFTCHKTLKLNYILCVTVGGNLWIVFQVTGIRGRPGPMVRLFMDFIS